MGRIQSIDIFRGLTIFVMVFVNDVAGVSGLPSWTYHAAADADAMTYVDIVFPAFLIIVGMSIPLAVSHRFDKGESTWQIIRHILVRTTGLIVLGVFMVNAGEMNKEANLIPASWWNILFYISAIAIWNQYPKERGKLYPWILQISGVIILVVLAFLFRKGEPDALTGMTSSWWGILGLIGWAYLIATMIYLAVKNNLAANIAMLSLLTIIAVGLMSPDLKLPSFIDWIKGQTGHIVHAGLVIAGVTMTLLLQKGASDNSGKTQLRWIAILAAFCFIAGFFLRPLYGVSKIYATPSWALYSTAWCCLVFLAIHWLVEIKKVSSWAGFLKPAGMNPLLTYILPYIYYAAVGFSLWPDILNQGLPGVIRSLVFSLIILWIAGYLSRLGIRLRL